MASSFGSHPGSLITVSSHQTVTATAPSLTLARYRRLRFHLNSAPLHAPHRQPHRQRNPAGQAHLEAASSAAPTFRACGAPAPPSPPASSMGVRPGTTPGGSLTFSRRLGNGDATGLWVRRAAARRLRTKKNNSNIVTIKISNINTKSEMLCHRSGLYVAAEDCYFWRFDDGSSL